MSDGLEKITVDFNKFEKLYLALKKSGVTEVSFECLVGSCFPNILHNIQQRIRLAHAQGYSQKLQDEGIEYIHFKK